jgi:hypothetical protein
MTGTVGEFPAAALPLYERLIESKVEEPREVSLLLDVWRAGYPAPVNGVIPKRAVLMDPPALDSYSFIIGERWAEKDTGVCVLKGTHLPMYADVVRTVIGKGKSRWSGWGYLLSEPSNPYDAGAIRVIVKGQHIGYLPREGYMQVRANIRASEAVGSLVVVRFLAYANESRVGVKISLDAGFVVPEF